MKNKKLISAILAAASIAGGVVGAQAADLETVAGLVDKHEVKIFDLQADTAALNTGVADNKAQIEANKKAIDKQHWQIDALEKKTGVNTPLTNGATNLSAGVNQNTRLVEAEATARKDADTKLQENVNAEATARKDADQKLQKQIDKNGFKADTALKVAGNGAMQNGATNLTDGVNQNTRLVEAEATARKDADTKLQENVNAEATARKDADQNLQKQIDANKRINKNQQQNIERNSSAIKTLQDNWKDSNRAFNKEQVDKIDKNEFKADAALKVAGNGAMQNGATNLTDGVNQNTRLVEAEATARKDADQKLQANIDAEATARKDADTKLQKQIDKNGIKADTALKVAGNGVLYNHATNLTDGVNENTKKIDANVKDIAANKTAIENEATARKDADTKLQNNINAEATIRENAVNALNSRIDQLGSDANKGIAKASALAALHPLDYDPDNKFDIAAAGGFYKGENAFALGAFYRPNRNVMLSMGTTLTDGDNAYNVGLTFKIGKSGKHTEAGLTTADLYAMIGAMQDKMDQQQKKIEELEAKQAK